MTILSYGAFLAAAISLTTGITIVAGGGTTWWRGLTLITLALILIAVFVFIPYLRDAAT